MNSFCLENVTRLPERVVLAEVCVLDCFNVDESLSRVSPSVDNSSMGQLLSGVDVTFGFESGKGSIDCVTGFSLSIAILLIFLK